LRHNENLSCGLLCLEECFTIQVGRKPIAEDVQSFDEQVQQSLERIGIENLASMPIVEFDIEQAAIMEVILLVRQKAHRMTLSFDVDGLCARATDARKHTYNVAIAPQRRWTERTLWSRACLPFLLQ
jgi:hypothetical protein